MLYKNTQSSVVTQNNTMHSSQVIRLAACVQNNLGIHAAVLARRHWQKNNTVMSTKMKSCGKGFNLNSLQPNFNSATVCYENKWSPIYDF